MGLYKLYLLVCGMWKFESVLRAAFSLSCVQVAVRTLVASLRACLASLGRRMHGRIYSKLVVITNYVQMLGPAFVEATDETLPYILYIF